MLSWSTNSFDSEYCTVFIFCYYSSFLWYFIVIFLFIRNKQKCLFYVGRLEPINGEILMEMGALRWEAWSRNELNSNRDMSQTELWKERGVKIIMYKIPTPFRRFVIFKTFQVCRWLTENTTPSLHIACLCYFASINVKHHALESKWHFIRGKLLSCDDPSVLLLECVAWSPKLMKELSKP